MSENNTYLIMTLKNTIIKWKCLVSRPKSIQFHPKYLNKYIAACTFTSTASIHRYLYIYMYISRYIYIYSLLIGTYLVGIYIHSYNLTRSRPKLKSFSFRFKLHRKKKLCCCSLYSREGSIFSSLGNKRCYMPIKYLVRSYFPYN